MQGHQELAALEIVFDFEGDIGEVAMVGYAQVLAALKSLVRPYCTFFQEKISLPSSSGSGSFRSDHSIQSDHSPVLQIRSQPRRAREDAVAQEDRH